MNTLQRLAVLSAILMLFCIALPTASAQEGSPGVDPQGHQAEQSVDPSPLSRNRLVMTKVVTLGDQQEALAFWTRPAVIAAQPMELLVDPGPVYPETAVLRASAAGAYGFTQPGRAAPEADLVAQAALPAEWAPTVLNDEPLDEAASFDAALTPEGSSQVYTSYAINGLSALQTIYPHKWIGRLSFWTPSGTAYCSATALNGNTIVTAAHCLYDSTSNNWYGGWSFQPAYRAGNAPYGTFSATQCWVLLDWANLSGGFSINSWSRHDVGVCRVGNNAWGTSLNNTIGYAGREWNYDYVRHVNSLGYPFKDYNDNSISSAGYYLRTCAAETFYQTTDTRGMGCNWGGGISGGPWLTGYAQNSGARGWVTGVNSGIQRGTPNMYGARFTSNNIVPLCNAAGC